MKLLFIHCDYIKFKAKQKALKNPEELTEEGKRQVEVKEPLVVFIAVEKRDENNKEIVEKLLTEIKDVAGKVNAKNIVLYPYAHLSSNLSNPQFAEETLKKAEEKLTRKMSISIKNNIFCINFSSNIFYFSQEFFHYLFVIFISFFNCDENNQRLF